jgi:signal transduction histidine kinase
MARNRAGGAPDASDDPLDPTTVRFTVGDLDDDTFVAEAKQAPRLVCLIGPCAGQAFRLGAAPQVIGRTAEADVRIDATDVSRRHARLEWRGGELVITDLGSSNGTSVNGAPIESKILHIGDRVQIGVSTILVYARHDELEQRAQRMQKLEGLAQLAGGLVHDFRNTLTVIQVNADLLAQHLARRSQGDAEATELLDSIGLAVSAAHEVTQRLLFFARREPMTDAGPVGLREVIDEVLAMTRHQLQGENAVRVDTVADARLTVRVRRSELQHALLNLVLNARDAMPKGGKLVVSARSLTLGLADAARRDVQPGRYQELAVADTGTGMDDATLARVFEPFFTTKPAGKGTGLGLSTVFGIVRDHGGSIEVESRPGEGTCFRILLPDGGSP